MLIGLLPIMWYAGVGADVMKRIAAPMIGGIFTSFVLEFVVSPVIWEILKWYFSLKRELATCAGLDARSSVQSGTD